MATLVPARVLRGEQRTHPADDHVPSLCPVEALGYPTQRPASTPVTRVSGVATCKLAGRGTLDDFSQVIPTVWCDRGHLNDDLGWVTHG